MFGIYVTFLVRVNGLIWGWQLGLQLILGVSIRVIVIARVKNLVRIRGWNLGLRLR